MPRKCEGPNYWESKNGWFVHIDGERVRLTSGPKNKETEREANRQYQEKLEDRKVYSDGDRSAIGAVLNAWLKWCANREDPPPLAPNTLAMYTRPVQTFLDMFGTVKSCDLKPHHFDEWLAKYREPHTDPKSGRVLSWGPGTRRLAMSTMRSALAWATTAGGLIKVNPLSLPGSEKLRTKRVHYKGKRTPISEAEHHTLVRHAMVRQNKDFAFLLMFLHGTGARPAELYLARKEEWDEGKGALVIQPTEENQGRFKLAYLGEPRLIYIPNDLLPLLRILGEKHPEGPLFRDQDGKPFTATSICSRFKSSRASINKKTGRETIRPQVSAYSYRHAYVTRWLMGGNDPIHLCELLNTSLTMIHKHYSHLFRQHETLRNSLNAFTTKPDEHPTV